SPTGYGNYTWYNGIWWEKPAPTANISVADSVLSLNWTKGQNPSDTSLTTISRDANYYHAWRYAYFEFRMKWDTVTGALPAIWLMPVQHAASHDIKEVGELDIFEGQGATPYIFYGTIHDWIDKQDARNNKGANYYQLSRTVDLSEYH